MSNDTTKYDICFADHPANSYYTHGLPAVLGFLEIALKPPRPSLLSIQTSRTNDVLLACDGTRVAVFHWDGSTLSAFLGKDATPKGAVHGLIDHRWMTLYFLPDNAYLEPQAAIDAAHQYLEGRTPTLVKIPQDTDEAIAVYDDLRAAGKIG